MSTLDDLRRTLDRHAGDLADRPGTDAVGRSAAVHGRVRAVRRRRRGALAVAAAVVAGTVVTGVLGGGGAPEPAGPDRRLGEVTAPATIESLGWTYEFLDGASGPSSATLRLEPTDRPLLVSWATESETARLQLLLGGSTRRAWSSTGDPFDDFTVVPAGQSARITVRGQDAALALYGLGDAAPEGHTHAGVTFREQTAEAIHLASTIGTPGAAEVELALPRPEGPLRLSYFCAGAASGYQHLSVNGERVMFGRGCDESTFDPAGQGALTLGPGGSTDLADPVRLRMWVTDGRRGPLVEDPAVQLGLGAYSEREPGARLLGYRVPAVRELDGHRWQLVRTERTPPGVHSISAETSRGVPTIAQMYWRRAGDAPVRGVVDGRATGSLFVSGSGGTTVDDWFVNDGSPVGARVRGPAPRVELALAVYERID